MLKTLKNFLNIRKIKNFFIYTYTDNRFDLNYFAVVNLLFVLMMIFSLFFKSNNASLLSIIGVIVFASDVLFFINMYSSYVEHNMRNTIIKMTNIMIKLNYNKVYVSKKLYKNLEGRYLCYNFKIEMVPTYKKYKYSFTHSNEIVTSINDIL